MNNNQDDLLASLIGFVSVQLSAVFGIMELDTVTHALIVGFVGAIGGYFGKKSIEYLISKIKKKKYHEKKN